MGSLLGVSILIGSGCASTQTTSSAWWLKDKTTDLLPKDSPKGYVEFYSAPTRANWWYRTYAFIYQIQGSETNAVGPVSEWLGGWPFEYHARRVACIPGTNTFVIVVSADSLQQKSGSTDIFQIDSNVVKRREVGRRQVDIVIIQNNVTPVKIESKLIKEVRLRNLISRTYHWDVMVECPQPLEAGWKPPYLAP